MSNFKPNKRHRSEFTHLRTLLGLSRQEQTDFSYADLRRYFRVKLWDKSHKCMYDKCPEPNKLITEFEDATLDHIIPRSKGGRTRWANVQLMHRNCNSKKSSKIMTTMSRRRFLKATQPARSRRGQVTKYELKKRGRNANNSSN